MIITQGTKVLIRAPEQTDSYDELFWSQDSEVVALDPPVNGFVMDLHRYSIDTQDGVHIGVCSLYSWTVESVQLGIRIGNKAYWGKGYGTEAVMLLTDHAYQNFGVTKVWLKVLPENIRAIRCYEKCGYVQTGEIAVTGRKFITMERRLAR